MSRSIHRLSLRSYPSYNPKQNLILSHKALSMRASMGPQGSESREFRKFGSEGCMSSRSIPEPPKSFEKKGVE